GKKGAGKGKNTKTFRGHAATKAGEPICFRFNQSEGCAIPSCKFKHVCSHCFDVNHNFIGCPKRRPAADTAGKH
ncbi:SWP2, partial [Symbiodinium pilosum]